MHSYELRMNKENFDTKISDGQYWTYNSIDAFKEDVLNFQQMFFETEIPDSYGRPQRTYLMNRDGDTHLRKK